MFTQKPIYEKKRKNLCVGMFPDVLFIITKTPQNSPNLGTSMG
jgi:hypothetical protein